VIVIGDPTQTDTDGTKVEVRFVREAGPIAAVHGDLIKDYNLKDGGTGVAFLELELLGPRGAGLLGLPKLCKEASIEIWTQQEGASPVLLPRTRAEHWNATFDESTERVLLQARSRTAVLVDAPLCLQHDGEARDLFSRVTSEVGVPLDDHDIPSRAIVAYIDAPSAYGALRLVGGALELVLRDQNECLNVHTRHGLLRAASRGVPPTIRTQDVAVGTLQQGTPLRKR